MKDDLNPEFLAFSAMLDQDELPEELLLDEDAKLLLELRRELQRDDAEQGRLPADFAKSTAAAVATRFQEQSGLTSGLLGWESFFRARLLSLRGITGGLLLSGALFGAYVISPQLLLGFGVFLLLAAVATRLLYTKYLPGIFELRTVRDLPEVRLPGLNYLLPLLTVFGAAAILGRAVASLGEVSLSVKASGAPVGLAGVATAGVVWVWLINAQLPIWKAASQKRGTALLMVWIHGLCGYGMMRIVTGEYSWEKLLLGWVLLCCVLSVAVFLTPEPSSPQLTWRKALGRCAMGLLVGLVPVLAATVLCYQYLLTRELNPQIVSLYQATQADFSTWESELQNIPPSQNGFTELRPFFIRSELEGASTPNTAAVRKNKDIAKRLKDGSQLWRDTSSSGQNPKKDLASYLRVRADFIKELPRIRKAVSKPHFSYLTKESYTWSTEVPNFILARAITQGLAGLVDESIQQGETEQALDYLELSLRWSTKMREGSLICLMIGIAQNSIAITDAERFVFEAKPSKEQLRSLATVLEEINPKRSDFRDTMVRDAMLSDRFLRELVVAEDVNSKISMMDSSQDSGVTLQILATLLPRGFWESERKAYLNLMLGFEKDWANLTSPGQDSIEELFEMNPVAQAVVPNSGRAQTRFTCMLSRIAALRTVIALELYKKDEGAYPDSLDRLVPKYIPAIPVDAMRPKRWEYKGTFDYLRVESGYELISESPLYAKISLATRQVYGPDGDYELAGVKKKP